MNRIIFALAALLSAPFAVLRAADTVPKHAVVSYGPSPHQLMDICVPTNGAGPFPVVI